MPRDYHRETAGDLTQLRTLLKHCENFLAGHRRSDPADDEIFKTVQMVRVLKEDLEQYRRKGRIVCRYCGRVEGSHSYGTQQCWRSETRYEPNA